ncbi:MAG: GNAT family N-acetyltransferase [Candidatus Levybacteria bacterium]|nr:GNAT family N-acetyltransferase [Candidatus Levybacteria bacterium]
MGAESKGGSSDKGSRRDQPTVRGEVFRYTPEKWDAVKDDITDLARQAQSSGVFRTDDIHEWVDKSFTNPHTIDNTKVLLREGNKVIGFALTQHSYGWSKEANDTVPSDTKAEITATIIDKDHRGNGYVGALMEPLDEDLRNKGFKSVVIRALSHQGYDRAIERHYGEKIVYSSMVTPDFRHIQYNL